jgi:hypothetical protein
MQELIDKSKAYKALMHESDTHMLPEYKEAYKRAARIVDQMKPDELPPFKERTCENCGSGDMFKYMHENKPSAPDNAAGEFLLYLIEQIPLDTLIAYVIKRKERGNARTD